MHLYRLIGAAIISIAVASWSSIASAQDEFRSRASCYLGLGGTFAHLLEAEDELGSNGSIDDSLGLNARLGCLGGVAGGELRYEYLDGFDAKKGSGRKFTVDGWAITFDLKLWGARFLRDEKFWDQHRCDRG